MVSAQNDTCEKGEGGVRKLVTVIKCKNLGQISRSWWGGDPYLRWWLSPCIHNSSKKSRRVYGVSCQQEGVHVMTAQPGEEKAPGLSSMSANTWREGAKRMEPGSFQWCPVTGQGAMGTN